MRQDSSASSRCSCWPQSVRRSPWRWWSLFESSPPSSSPSSTSATPSRASTGSQLCSCLVERASSSNLDRSYIKRSLRVKQKRNVWNRSVTSPTSTATYVVGMLKNQSTETDSVEWDMNRKIQLLSFCYRMISSIYCVFKFDLVSFAWPLLVYLCLA